MEPMKDITQNEISETIDNPIDKAGNKIKLRSVSHENIIRHLQNVPYKTKKGPKLKSSKINLPKEPVEWNLTPKQYVDSIVDGRKPINVKENMIENIIKHSEPKINEEEKGNVMEDNNKNIINEEPMVNTVPIQIPNNQEVEIKTEPMVETKSEPEIEIKAEPKVEIKEEPVVESNVQVNVLKDLDVEKEYKEISSIREKVINKKELMEQTQQEAIDSEKYVQNLGVQYTEVQKQLEEAKARNREMKQQLVKALKSQKETLEVAIKQYDSMIDEANERKETNKNLTAEIQPKIDNTQNETDNINNDTARIEEYLNAIMSDNVVSFPPKDNTVEEEKIRRVA